MKYIKNFATQTELDAYLQSDELVKPYLLYAQDTANVVYSIPVINGVAIQHIDGSIYTKDEWATALEQGTVTNEQANGVLAGNGKYEFVVSPIRNGSAIWGTYSSKLDVLIVTELNERKRQFNGRENTELIINTNGGNGANPAAEACAAYTFPNGKTGFLPAYGQLTLMLTFKAEIDECLTAIGGQTLHGSSSTSSGFTVSSTLTSSLNAANINLRSGYINGSNNLSTSFYIRAITERY